MGDELVQRVGRNMVARVPAAISVMEYICVLPPLRSHSRSASPDAVARFLAGEPTPVASSRITHAHYDRDAQRLTVTFKDGTDFYYPNVDEHLARRFAESSSKGKFISAELDMLGGGPV